MYCMYVCCLGCANILVRDACGAPGGLRPLSGFCDFSAGLAGCGDGLVLPKQREMLDKGDLADSDAAAGDDEALAMEAPAASETLEETVPAEGSSATTEHMPALSSTANTRARMVSEPGEVTTA